MRRKNSLRKDNRGASLLAVLMVLVVVTAIGVVITKVTITNIQMKEVERATKKNFYSAESLMDAVYAGVGEKASDAMGKAYQFVLENYADIKSGSRDPQEEFKRKYIDELHSTFGVVTGTGIDWDETTDPSGSQVYFRKAPYTVSNLKDCVASTYQSNIITQQDDNVSVCYEDYEEGTFTLKNVKVKYKNDQNFEDTIQTDLVFSVPSMKFDGNQAKEFMKYSLIANKQISVGSSPAGIGGNIYAGPGGIVSNGSNSASFTGNTIITRGDIVTEESSSLTFGNGSSSIWAQNIETKRGGASRITVNGNCYVEDDLTLNGAGSTVDLNGTYYGYNFQKNYDTTVSEPAIKAEYSSAMMVNGKEAHLKLDGLNYLMLAGRTYLARGEKNPSNLSEEISDVKLGESLSVRTNQLAYYVKKEYLDTVNLKFKEDKIKNFQNENGITGLENLLNSTKQVVPYYYKDKGAGDSVNYYLNFKDEASANEYFKQYCEGSKKTEVNKLASIYAADAIKLGNGAIYTLNGDVLCVDPDSESPEIKIGMSGGWTPNDVYWNRSSQLAVKYKALQLGLTSTNPKATAKYVRITSGDAITSIPDAEKLPVDKNVLPMFDHLINQTAFSGLSGTHNTPLTLDDTGAVTYNVYCTDGTYEVNTGDFTQSSGMCNGVIIAKGNVTVGNSFHGIIVSGGDVQVNANFSGMIISDGTITFTSGVVVDSDEFLVSQLFEKDIKNSTHLFSQYFNDFGGTVDGTNPISGLVDMKQYLTYDNWKKNV